MDGRFDEALHRVGTALGGVDPASLDTACAMIVGARRIGVYGCGREGYQLRGLAMRLYHLGCTVGYVGDTTMPPLGAGDLLIVSAGPGELATVTAQMTTARAARARLLLFTAVPGTPSAALADHVLAVPAQTMASDGGDDGTSMLPMGSVYEGALFFVFEAMVADLRGRLGQTAQTMRARHTNME